MSEQHDSRDIEPGDIKRDDIEADDLEVTQEQAKDVKGGKVQFQDFHFTKKVDQSSP